MAPIKQEEHMKDRLEKRRLQPSPESWASLSNRLDAEQKNKTKSLYWWFGIAASIVGIVVVTAVYFNSNTFENIPPSIVDTEDTFLQKKDDQNNVITDQQIVVEEVGRADTISNEAEQGSKLSYTISEKKKIVIESPKETSVAQTDNTISNEDKEQVAEMKKPALTFEDQKVQEVVAQINSLNSDGTTVTDAEIDNLLKKAQKEILSNRIYNATTRTVDANALLQDVEDDLQRSFRAKVLEALQSGYESVRTSVAGRNN